MTETEIVHVAGPFTDGRQLCTRCGVVLVTTDPNEIVGVANWPPPWAPGPVRVSVGPVGPTQWWSMDDIDWAARWAHALCPEIAGPGPGGEA